MSYIEEPVVTKGDRDETVTTHPAYAQIGVSRVTGQASLYGSDFKHHNFMTISARGAIFCI
jgi:hypothetical protein